MPKITDESLIGYAALFGLLCVALPALLYFCWKWLRAFHLVDEENVDMHQENIIRTLLGGWCYRLGESRRHSMESSTSDALVTADFATYQQSQSSATHDSLISSNTIVVHSTETQPEYSKNVRTNLSEGLPTRNIRYPIGLTYSPSYTRLSFSLPQPRVSRGSGGGGRSVYHSPLERLGVIFSFGAQKPSSYKQNADIIETIPEITSPSPQSDVAVDQDPTGLGEDKEHSAQALLNGSRADISNKNSNTERRFIFYKDGLQPQPSSSRFYSGSKESSSSENSGYSNSLKSSHSSSEAGPSVSRFLRTYRQAPYSPNVPHCPSPPESGSSDFSYYSLGSALDSSSNFAASELWASGYRGHRRVNSKFRRTKSAHSSDTGNTQTRSATTNSSNTSSHAHEIPNGFSMSRSSSICPTVGYSAPRNIFDTEKPSEGDNITPTEGQGYFRAPSLSCGLDRGSPAIEASTINNPGHLPRVPNHSRQVNHLLGIKTFTTADDTSTFAIAKQNSNNHAGNGESSGVPENWQSDSNRPSTRGSLAFSLDSEAKHSISIFEETNPLDRIPTWPPAAGPSCHQSLGARNSSCSANSISTIIPPNESRASVKTKVTEGIDTYDANDELSTSSGGDTDSIDNGKSEVESRGSRITVIPVHSGSSVVLPSPTKFTDISGSPYSSQVHRPRYKVSTAGLLHNSPLLAPVKGNGIIFPSSFRITDSENSNLGREEILKWIPTASNPDISSADSSMPTSGNSSLRLADSPVGGGGYGGDSVNVLYGQDSPQKSNLEHNEGLAKEIYYSSSEEHEKGYPLINGELDEQQIVGRSIQQLKRLRRSLFSYGSDRDQHREGGNSSKNKLGKEGTRKMDFNVRGTTHTANDNAGIGKQDKGKGIKLRPKLISRYSKYSKGSHILSAPDKAQMVAQVDSASTSVFSGSNGGISLDIEA